MCITFLWISITRDIASLECRVISISLYSNIAVFEYRCEYRFRRISLYLISPYSKLIPNSVYSNITLFEYRFLGAAPPLDGTIFRAPKAQNTLSTTMILKPWAHFRAPLPCMLHPRARKPCKIQGFWSPLLSEMLKSVKNHWFLQYFQPSGPPRWGQDGLQDEAKMGVQDELQDGVQLRTL